MEIFSFNQQLKSFGENTPVDLLEYHDGEFLLERGDVEKAKTFFRKSSDKGEDEGARRLCHKLVF